MDDRGIGWYEGPYERTSPHRIPGSRGGAGVRQHPTESVHAGRWAVHHAESAGHPIFLARAAGGQPGHPCVPAAHLCYLGVQLGATGSAPARVSPAQSLAARGSDVAVVPAALRAARRNREWQDRGAGGRSAFRRASDPYRGGRQYCGTLRIAGCRIPAGRLDPTSARSGNTRPALLFAGAAFEGIGGGVFAAGAGGRLCPRQVEAACALRAHRRRDCALPRAAVEGPRRPLRPARHRTAR